MVLLHADEGDERPPPRFRRFQPHLAPSRSYPGKLAVGLEPTTC